MPNNGRITLCPYYRDEKNLSISCEDVFRRFRWPAQKKRHLDTYCDDNWKNCPHAQELNKLYEELGGNMSKTKEKILQLEHKCKVLEKELRNTASLLGRAEKREQDKDAQIKILRRKSDELERMYIENRNYAKNETVLYEQLRGITNDYLARIAYLMSEYAGGVLDERAVKKWVKNHEYEIKPTECVKSAIGLPEALGYMVTVKERENGDKGSATEDESSSGTETGESKATGKKEN